MFLLVSAALPTAAAVAATVVLDRGRLGCRVLVGGCSVNGRLRRRRARHKVVVRVRHRRSVEQAPAKACQALTSAAALTALPLAGADVCRSPLSSVAVAAADDAAGAEAALAP